jgi:hypothetical protein
MCFAFELACRKQSEAILPFGDVCILHEILPFADVCILYEIFPKRLTLSGKIGSHSFSPGQLKRKAL